LHLSFSLVVYIYASRCILCTKYTYTLQLKPRNYINCNFMARVTNPRLPITIGSPGQPGAPRPVSRVPRIPSGLLQCCFMPRVTSQVREGERTKKVFFHTSFSIIIFHSDIQFANGFYHYITGIFLHHMRSILIFF